MRRCHVLNRALGLKDGPTILPPPTSLLLIKNIRIMMKPNIIGVGGLPLWGRLAGPTGLALALAACRDACDA